MTEEYLTVSHLSVAMTTKEDSKTPTVGKKWWAIDEFYLQMVVVVIGVVGTAGNALILYAMVVCKQHKKHVLIVNQNALDLFSSFFLVVSFSVKLCNIQLVGALGYWLCIAFISEIFVWCCLTGSVVNLAIITIDRYLKVVHHIWSKRRIRSWVIKSAMAFAWLVGIVTNTVIVLETSGVIDGECYTWVLFKSHVERTLCMMWYVMSSYIIILVIFVYCYGQILIVVRRQARVMSSHRAAGSSTCQTQSHQIQTNVTKTMVFISAFYAVAWLPVTLYDVFIMVNPNLTYMSSYWYASVFVVFLYTSANPFIYATKFKPVRRILIDMIPCKKTTVQPTASPRSGVRTGVPKRY